MPQSISRLTPSPQVLAQVVGGEAVLLDLESEKYFGLNTVGLRVWELLHDDNDVQSMRTRMLAEYAVEPARLDKDLDDLLGRLVEAGLLKSSI